MPGLEALGAAASIIALVQLAAKLAKTSYDYVGAVKRAPKDAQDLVAELNSLYVALENLQKYADKNPGSEALGILNAKDGPLPGCALQLEGLQKNLEISSRKGLRRVFSSLKWPFKEAETLQIISRIERLKSLFSIAMGTDHIFLSKAIKQDVEGVGFSVEEFLKEYRAEVAAQNARRQVEKAIHEGKERQEVLDWFYSGDTETRHSEISKDRQKYTGRWLLESRELRDWATDERNPSLLWGYGIPGAGKTFLSSAVIDDFKDQARGKELGIGYIYFNYKEQAQQTTTLIIRSLVRQLGYQIDKLPTGVGELYEKIKREGRHPTLEELYTIFLVVFRSFGRAFLVFDALDECDPKERQKVLLPMLHRMGNDGVRLFLTSRDHQDIRDSLGGVPQIRLSAKGDDIKYYIQEKINEDPQAKRLIQQGKCEDKIISELTECAQGMFLLVRFHIDYLCQQTTPKQILTALEELRTSSTVNTPLDPTYDRVIENINQKSESRRDLAIMVFTWLVTAKRLLTVKELQVAVSVKQERYELDELELPDRDMILEVCASLVTIDEASDIVRLAHFTVQEYLQRKSIIHDDAALRITTACLTYLSFDIFGKDFCTCGPMTNLYSHGYCTFWREFYNPPKIYSLLRYAARYLSSHLKSCNEEESLKALLRFLKGQYNIYSYRRALYREGRGVEGLGEYPIHLASSLGHLLAIQKLLGEGADISALDQRGQTALFSATSLGYERVVYLLIEKGADVSAVNNFMETPLFGAAYGGHDAVVRFLVEKGADVSAVNSKGETALFGTTYYGHEEIVRFLVEKGADVSFVSGDGETALFEAARYGYEAIARFLVEIIRSGPLWT